MDAKNVNYFIFTLAFGLIPQVSTTLTSDKSEIFWNANNREAETFVWKSCGNSSDPIQIGNLTVYQNTSEYLYASGNFKLDFDMSSPIQGKVALMKNVWGLWVPVPCIDNVGTCSYDDICALSPYEADCPKHYTDYNLPCRCPLLQGSYTFDRFPVDARVLPKFIERGWYTVKLSLTQHGKRLICVKMTIKLQ